MIDNIKPYNPQVNMNSHFYWLDLFRFLAALIVVTSHIRGTVFVEYASIVDKTFFTTVFFAITRIANEAVIVFFVLSGFLVGGRALDRILNGTFQPTNYAIDRVVRIMLPLIPALIITAVIRIIIDGSFSNFELIGNIFSLQGILVQPFGYNSPLWSLSYEVWFYILAYMIGIATINKAYGFLATSLFILIAAIFTILDSTYLFSWLIGMMVYIRRPTLFSWKIFLFSIGLFVYSIIAIQIGKESISISADYLKDYLPSLNVSRILLSAGIALIIQQVILVKPKKYLTIKLDSIGTVLAASSYTLYLTHYPLLQLFAYVGLQRSDQINFYTMGIFIATIFMCLFFSWLVYLLFEKHTKLVKRNFKQWVR